jgi:hypothetical protein
LSAEEEEEKTRLLEDRARSQRLEDEAYARQLEKYNKITRHQLGGQEQAIKRYHEMFGLTPDPESFPSQAPLEEFTRPGYDQWGKPLSGQEAADARYQALVGSESAGNPLAGTELDTSRKKEGGGKLSTLLKWGLPIAGGALALGGLGVPGFKFLGPAASGIGKFLFGTGGEKAMTGIGGQALGKLPPPVWELPGWAGKQALATAASGAGKQISRNAMPHFLNNLSRAFRQGRQNPPWYTRSRGQTRPQSSRRPFGTLPDPLGSNVQRWDQ